MCVCVSCHWRSVTNRMSVDHREKWKEIKREEKKKKKIQYEPESDALRTEKFKKNQNVLLLLRMGSKNTFGPGLCSWYFAMDTFRTFI